MRILLINQSAVTDTENSGTRHYELAKGLVRLGFHVTIIAGHINHFNKKPIRNFRKQSYIVEYRKGVRFVWVREHHLSKSYISRLWNMIHFAVKVRAVERKFKNEYFDIIWGSSPSLFASYGAMKIAKRRQVSFVFEIRDLWPESIVQLTSVTSKHILVRLMYLLESHQVKNANKIITCLPHVDDYLNQKYQYPKDKLLWLPNFTPIYKVPDETINNKTAKNEFKVCYAGAFNLANDVITIVQAARILQYEYYDHNVRIILCGEGPEKNNIQHYINKLKLNNIKIEAYSITNNLYQRLQEQDVLIATLKDLSLYHWGTSLRKIPDYLLSSKPIIYCSNEQNSVIQQAECGFHINPENPKKLAETIIQVKQMSDEERAILGEQGRSYAKRYLNESELVSRLEQFLREICTYCR